MMSRTTTGWLIFIAALGMMFSLISVDVVSLKDWNETLTPGFVGSMMAHLAAVITAFVGGKLIPSGPFTDRVSDVKLQEINNESGNSTSNHS